MYAKSLLKDMKYTSSAMENINKIISEFIRIKNDLGIVDIDITYFLFKTNIPKRELYDTFHILMEEKLIVKKIYIVCPNCMHDQKIINAKKIVKCYRCGLYFDIDTNIEKFALQEEINI